MDFICRLDTGENILVEMQIISYDYWDQRALAYVAAVYSKQLRRGGRWNDIKRIIGIYILRGRQRSNSPLERNSRPIC